MHKGSNDYYHCRNCGQFFLRRTLTQQEQNREFFTRNRHLLAGLLFETNRVSENPYDLLEEDVKYIIDEFTISKYLSNSLIPHSFLEKFHKILNYININTTFYGENIKIPLVCSYAMNNSELFNILSDLNSDGLIYCELDDSEEYYAAITSKGIEYLNQNSQTIKSDQCFIAMWFADEMDSAWQDAIKPACQSAGYDPKRIDEEPHNGDIVDKIMAMIRESYFVIADQTGNRGGVYFEAGFAKGLGKEVIFTCKKNWFDDPGVHFDTEHMNLILWEDPEDLREKLQYRIEATLGKGSYSII